MRFMSFTLFALDGIGVKHLLEEARQQNNSNESRRQTDRQSVKQADEIVLGLHCSLPNCHDGLFD